MARKRSASGRARAKTIENTILLQTKRINKRIRSLERAGEYGKYKSKELMQYVARTPYLTIRKARGSKRRRLIVSKIQKTIGQLRETRKKFDQILKSRVFSPIGIKAVRKETKDKVKKTLSEEAGRKLTDRDVDRFYEILEYRDKVNEESILSKIDVSSFQTLVDSAKEQNYNKDQWVDFLRDYVDINNEYMKKEAMELYLKFIA